MNRFQRNVDDIIAEVRNGTQSKLRCFADSRCNVPCMGILELDHEGKLSLSIYSARPKIWIKLLIQLREQSKAPTSVIVSGAAEL